MCRGLQSLLAVVPQNPVILHGSIADNLDPLGRHTPHDLMAVLYNVRLLSVLAVHAEEQCAGRSAAGQGGAGASTSSLFASCQDPVVCDASRSAVRCDADAEEPLLPVTDTTAHDGQTCGHHFDVLGVQLGEDGAVLSVGQQQLLSVARALLRNPMVLCLDELCAHLSDAESTIIETVVSERLKNRTCVRISHDVEILMACDTVGILECGQLVDVGPPNDLRSLLLNLHNVTHAHDITSEWPV